MGSWSRDSVRLETGGGAGAAASGSQTGGGVVWRLKATDTKFDWRRRDPGRRNRGDSTVGAGFRCASGVRMRVYCLYFDVQAEFE